MELALRNLPERDRYDAWMTATAEAFVPVDVRPGRGALDTSVLRTHAVGDLRISDVEGATGDVVRGNRRLGRTIEPYLIVAVHRSGHGRVMQDGRRADLMAGDLVCFRTDHPYTLTFPGRFHQCYVRLPLSTLLGTGAPFTNLTATPITTQFGIARLLRPLLCGLVAEADRIGGPGALPLTTSVMELVSAALIEAAHPASGQPNARRLLYERMESYVAARVCDPELTPIAVAAAHHVSLRYLHAAYADAGTTFGRSVRERRLHAAANELRRRGAEHRTVAAVAHACGFTDVGHFSRQFRAAFGSAPGAWRRLHSQ